MNKILAVSLISMSLLMSCKDEKKETNVEVKQDVPAQSVTQPQLKFKNKAHELVYEMTQNVGDYKMLLDKKDVVYTLTYQTPDGKEDIITEKYIFNGEWSYGRYTKHERTLPELKGIIEQGYDGNEYWLKQDGKIITDINALKRVAFNRPTNFYWFTMMAKLTDPGLNYEYVKTQKINDINYDVVKITFNSEDGKPKDTYQVYINPETKLVDQFLFTVMDFGKSDPLLMQLEYIDVDGVLIPAKRKYKASNWDAEVTDKPWINVNWTNIRFNNGLDQATFTK
ncbi:hypothetical protein FNB79_12235 [Formosa sediminum]|uniref:Outer membrane lipoprotein-sorting protein n=1 Tax=Formosa sediminum TaxID=2594004 RepID=A0A516GT42_9FLAO|nr:DUF6503 family protein [Formosa sediminum]QDO94696.1 hypothetical protein FNB79_12235 [Formosa sediminum]